MKKIIATIALFAFSTNIFASSECLAHGTREEILECLKRAEEQKNKEKSVQEKIVEFVKKIKISL